ncbi:MAG: hypothetical protein NC225_02950 [Clostridium sp.]|nr:hypothetical protein [Clostridium sp.]MCM1398423.1 hypothetical protein [Clostridium sp.]MCM1458912.1 hypothetical protein [Bacteroides sp.]
MKSDNVIWIFLLIVFLLLGTTEVLLYKSYEDNRKTAEDAVTTKDADYSDLILTTNADFNISDDLAGEDTEVPDTHTYIFVGDSRYVAMSECKSASDSFFCENGVGLYYLNSHMSDIMANADNNTRIIVGLGVNDVGVGNDGYVQALTQLNTSCDAEVYYMLVNPVDDAKCASIGYPVTNAAVESFNTKMLEGLNGSGIKIIDTYTFLTTNGYTTYDGLHYDEKTTQTIYDFIKRCLRNQ